MIKQFIRWRQRRLRRAIARACAKREHYDTKATRLHERYERRITEGKV